MHPPHVLRSLARPLRLLPRTLGWAALGLAFLAGPALAEDGESAPQTIQWVEGWEAGRKQAAQDGRIVFLYFGRKSPT